MAIPDAKQFVDEIAWSQISLQTHEKELLLKAVRRLQAETLEAAADDYKSTHNKKHNPDEVMMWFLGRAAAVRLGYLERIAPERNRG